MLTQGHRNGQGERARIFLANGLLLLAALSLTLVALEVALRSFDSSRPAPAAGPRDNEWLFFEYDTLLGWRNRPGAEGWFSIPDSRTWIEVDAHGLRDVDPGPHDPAGPRILVLGDSFTWGFGVDRRDRYTERLASRLPDGVEVLNAGVSGYGTDQELLYLRAEGLAWQPNLVIVQFGLEDIINNNHSIQYSYPKPFFRLTEDGLALSNVPVPSRRAPWDMRFELPAALQSRPAELPRRARPAPDAGSRARRFKLFLRRHLRSYEFLVDRVARPWLLPAREPRHRAAASVDPVTAALFRHMRDLVEDRGSTLVVLFIPYRFHMEGGFGDTVHQAYLSFFDEEGIPCLDLWGPFRRQTALGERLYFDADPHWTPAGHELAGELLSRFLRRSGALAGASPSPA